MKQLIETLDAQFLRIHRRAVDFVVLVPPEKLYWQPREREALFPVNSCGEYILRSAAAVEQTFGGITTRLWDDPFEWTLPEKLHSVALITQYLDEVDRTRMEGIAFIATDESLSRSIPAPVKIIPMSQVLVEALSRSEHYLGRAYAVFQMISDKKLPRIESL